MTRPQSQAIAERIANECLLAQWRKMSRVLTGIYDTEMRSSGLKSSQLNLLVAVAKAGPVRRTNLGQWLHFDPSTLTRNLRIMLKQGWIEEMPDDSDGRASLLKITGKGRGLLESIAPAWKRAQARAKQMLGTAGAALVLRLKEAVR